MKVQSSVELRRDTVLGARNDGFPAKFVVRYGVKEAMIIINNKLRTIYEEASDA
jgi:hypothetical protein